MKKFKQFFVMFAAVLLFAAVQCGCQSTGYYQDQAVQSARSFLLEEMPDIPLMDQEYIKFNRPFLLYSHLSGSQSNGTAQVCICWMTPDNPDIYMVYGTSSVSMIDWVPLRIIRKSFEEPQKNYLKLAKAASYEIIQQYFGMLSAKSLNHVRYTLPGLWKSKFPLDMNPAKPAEPAPAEDPDPDAEQIDETNESTADKQGKLPIDKPEKVQPAKESLDDSENPEDTTQPKELASYVLAWKIEENGKKFYLIYGGTAKDNELTDFEYCFSGISPENEFKDNVIDTVPMIEPFGGKAGQ